MDIDNVKSAFVDADHKLRKECFSRSADDFL